MRQGDAFSLRLFTATLELALRTVDWEDCGVMIDGKLLSHICFADDVCLIAPTPLLLQLSLEKLDEACSRIGLKINAGKTVTMSNRIAPALVLHDQPVEAVATFKYLGRLVSFIPDRQAELRSRIGAAWSAFNKHRDFFISRRTPLDLKARLFNAVVLPTLLYGCETWTCTDTDWHLLQVAQRRMERRMVGTTLLHRRPNIWLRSRSGTKEVKTEAERRKLNWARRIASMDGERWPRRLADWTPREFTRRSGGQKPRWRDMVVARHGNNWLRALSHSPS